MRVQDGVVKDQALLAATLRETCIRAGADDAGFASITSPALGAERQEILTRFPFAKTLISLVFKLNRENVRTPLRSIANLEFHQTTDHANEVARDIVKQLEALGFKAVNPAAGFPMEMAAWPGRLWAVSHKLVAVAAGTGRMGINRLVLHPVHGAFVTLGTIVTDALVTQPGKPLDQDPCLECKLCVAACPTGAISPDGAFDFNACYTHNYREFMGGFVDWAETVASSGSARKLRAKISDAESVSMWQSLAFGPNYKAAFCMSVCPAGTDVFEAYKSDRAGFVNDVMKPLTDKVETLYVVKGSDAERHGARRFPHKRRKIVPNTLRPNSIRGFLSGLPWAFQRGASKGLEAVYHFDFRGEENEKATVSITNGTLKVEPGHVGNPSLTLRADSRTWIRFLAKEVWLPWALLRGAIRIKGDPRLLLAFGRCFPS
jgi:NAD-dependent dihydropyrimidine dehydrogenase PreA subunit